MRLNDENRILPERVPAQRMPELSPGAPDVVMLPPAPDGAAGDIVSTGELARVLRRRKTALFAAVLLGLGGGIAASILTTPVYRARAMLQIDSPNESHFLREITPVSSAAPESYFNNQMKLLASDTVARRVADRLGIKAPGPDAVSLLDRLTKAEAPSEEEQRIAIVKSAIRTRTSMQSQVVELTFDAPTPERAAMGANAVAAEFIEVNREARDNLVRNTTEWLTREAAALKTKLDESRRELEAYMRTSGLTFAAGPLTLAEERTRQLQQALAAAETDRAANQARLEAALRSPIEALPDIVTTGAIRDYQTERERL
ncbi:MAG: Wzz/FepE/Etk N-terminal domain-containing protein, partial [bacterium]